MRRYNKDVFDPNISLYIQEFLKLLQRKWKTMNKNAFMSLILRIIIISMVNEILLLWEKYKWSRDPHFSTYYNKISPIFS